MYDKICALCGKPFTSQYIRSKYCRGCQARAYRQNDTNRARERRAEAIKAEREYFEQQKREEAQAREQELQKRLKKERKAKERRARSGDPLARLSLEGEKPHSYYNLEYWRAYQAYELSQDCGGRFEKVVNGVSCREDNFAELVLETLKVKNKIVTGTLFHNEGVKDYVKPTK